MPTPALINFPEIRRRREALGLTLQQAGEAAGREPKYARQWFSSFESGRFQDPQVSTLLAVAEALKCDIGDLLIAKAGERPRPRKVQNRSSSSGSAGSRIRPA